MNTVSLSNWQDFLIELQLPRQIVFGHEHPLLAELTGLQRSGESGNYVYTRDPNQQRFTKAMDTGRSVFTGGSEFTVPLQLSDVSSAAGAEGADYPQPAPFDTDKARYNLHSRHTPIGATLELIRDAKSGSTSALSTVEGLTDSAYRSAARTDEDFLHGNGDGVLATQTAADAAGLTITVGVGANFDQLTKRRIIDVRTAAGVLVTNGGRRKIAAVNRTAGTITLDAAQVASDGGVGNLPLGIVGNLVCIDSSFGNAPAGLGNVAAATGIYGGINKANVQEWQGVQVDGGATALSDDHLDDAVYLLRGNGVGAPDFGIAHPLTVNPYKASKTQFLMVEPQTAMVPSGFRGVIYQGADKDFPILKALAAPRKTCRLVFKEPLRVYGDTEGAGFIDDDGSMWRFFGRNTKKEADLFDRWELASRDCGKLAEITDLSE